MKEAVLILLVVAALMALTAYRYRRQIATAVHIWRMLRSARQAVRRGGESIPDANEPSARILVNCSKCGKWVPETSSIKLGKLHYCSRSCFETAAKVRPGL